MRYQGLERTDTTSAQAGDIIALSGIPEIMIGETITDIEHPIALPLLKIEEPTVKATIAPNTSPLAGREGDFCTSRQSRARLYRELETDMALRVEDSSQSDWIVSVRGELHLEILIERLRREGYEFEVSAPQVITKEIDGRKMTPYEKLFIEVPEEYGGIVIQKLGARNGELIEMRTDDGITFLEYLIPTRSLIGYRGEFLTDTRGTGILNSLFENYLPDPGKWPPRTHGSLVSHETGVTTQFSLINIQARGTLFLEPGIPVYKGQIVGQNARDTDMSVNVTKGKQLTNIRSKGDGVSEHFNTPRIMDLEACLQYIGDDELLEVTPKSLRLRKRILDAGEARRKQLGLT
jgi:GTP-binding protein